VREKIKKKSKKTLPSLFKFIKNADEIKISMNNDIFELPNRKTNWMESGHDGHSTTTFEIYHKKRNQTKEIMKRAWQ